MGHMVLGRLRFGEDRYTPSSCVAKLNAEHRTRLRPCGEDRSMVLLGDYQPRDADVWSTLDGRGGNA